MYISTANLQCHVSSGSPGLQGGLEVCASGANHSWSRSCGSRRKSWKYCSSHRASGHVDDIVEAVQEVVKLVPQERVQQPSVEHATVPQILEETVEVTSLAPK